MTRVLMFAPRRWLRCTTVLVRCDYRLVEIEDAAGRAILIDRRAQGTTFWHAHQMYPPGGNPD